jgi:hypothetical protein
MVWSYYYQISCCYSIGARPQYKARNYPLTRCSGRTPVNDFAVGFCLSQKTVFNTNMARRIIVGTIHKNWKSLLLSIAPAEPSSRRFCKRSQNILLYDWYFNSLLYPYTYMYLLCLHFSATITNLHKSPCYIPTACHITLQWQLNPKESRYSETVFR